jgi:tetratricopeptide (TPR) repeat protein
VNRLLHRVYVVGGVLVGLAVSASILHAREARYRPPAATERLLYLQSGKVADRLMLSFDSLAADVYWIRTIQHYGRDRKSARTANRFELLNPLLDLTTSLDPNFMIAYRFGAIFLAMPMPDGPGRTDQAIALLEKGLRANPARWQYAHDIAFIHYWYTGDYAAAAAWFERAAALPGAPAWIGPLAATTKAQGGNRNGARHMLVELASSSEEYIRNAASRGLRQLRALDSIDELNAMIEKFNAAHGRYPRGWEEIFGGRGVPGDETGMPFLYDAETHSARLSPQSQLSPLPRPLR